MSEVDIEQYFDQVHKLAHQYKGKTTLEYDDLFQAGCEGLIHAKRTFNPEKSKFITWAHIHISGQMLAAIKKNSTVHLPEGVSDLKRKFEKMKSKLSVDGPVTDAEVYEALDWEDKNISIRESLHTGISSINVKQSQDEEFSGFEIEGREIDPAEAWGASEEAARVKKLVDTLDDREKMIALAFMNGHSQVEIAKMLNFTPQRISQIWNEVKSKLASRWERATAH